MSEETVEYEAPVRDLPLGYRPDQVYWKPQTTPREYGGKTVARVAAYVRRSLCRAPAQPAFPGWSVTLAVVVTAR